MGDCDADHQVDHRAYEAQHVVTVGIPRNRARIAQHRERIRALWFPSIAHHRLAAGLQRSA